MQTTDCTLASIPSYAKCKAKQTNKQTKKTLMCLDSSICKIMFGLCIYVIIVCYVQYISIAIMHLSLFT